MHQAEISSRMTGLEVGWKELGSNSVAQGKGAMQSST
jgi:hypothetical protein